MPLKPLMPDFFFFFLAGLSEKNHDYHFQQHIVKDLLKIVIFFYKNILACINESLIHFDFLYSFVLVHVK